MSTPLWVFDIDNGRVAWSNRAATKLWNADSMEELCARDMSHDMSVSVRTRLRQYQEDFENEGTGFTEIWTVYPNGVPRSVRVIFSGHRLADGRMGMLCEALDENKQEPEALRSAEALLHTSVMIAQYSLTGNMLYSNPAARASHKSANETLDMRFADPAEYVTMINRLQRHGECRMAARVQTAHGVRWHEIAARECLDAATGDQAYLLTEHDISDLKETERRVRYLADHDVLTGLPNRNYIQTQLPQEILEASASNRSLIFLILDLDRFKSINDSLGHAAGDELLVKVSNRLQGIIGANGIVARLGGDEFLICLRDSDTLPSGQNIRDALLGSFKDKITIRSHNFVVTPSVGVARFPEDGKDLSSLLVNADLALYEAKEAGRNNCVTFSQSLQTRMEEQLQLENDLQNALDNDEFELFYQPRVDAKSNTITGAEALIRWRHPTRGLVPPNLFIPICEESGLINKVGDWVLRSVANEQRRMKADGHDITLSLNLSPKQFVDGDLMHTVLSLREDFGCDPERLELEITESMLMSDDSTAIEQLEAFRREGFKIAIDDFGTGFCNLAYIQRYPITSLKIDRTFINNIEVNGAVTSLIVSLCHLIGVKAVAEGVETEDQLNWLRAKNCDEFQGYLFSPPVPLDAFRKQLSAPETETTENIVVLENARA